MKLTVETIPAPKITGEKIISPENVYCSCKQLAKSGQEAFLIITLSAKNGLIKKRIISVGISNSAIITPKEVMYWGIKDSANGIILVHNHPSGEVTPSSEDISLTNKMIQAGVIMGIPVIDHIITGKDSYVSLRENGYCSF